MNLLVFMVLTAFWTQVEYRAAQLMPWILMSRGPTTASESIFLDYMSPWNVVSLFRSLRWGHYLVSLCVAASLLINGLAALSTGLFELNEIWISRNTDIAVQYKFDASNFNPIKTDGRSFIACLGTFHYDMSPAVGIHDRRVFSPFQKAGLDPARSYTLDENHEYEAGLDVLTLNLECQNATYSVETVEGRNTSTYESDGCKIHQRGGGPALPLISGEYGYNVDIFSGGCQGEHIVGDNNPERQPWDVDWRLWASVAQGMHSSSEEPLDKRQMDDNPYPGWEEHEVRALMCTLRYNMSHGPVRVWRLTGQDSVSSSMDPDKLKASNPIANLTAGQLLSAGYNSVLSLERSTARSGVETALATQSSSKELWDSMSTFANAVEASYNCIVLQVVRNSLLSPVENSVDGIERFIETRLFVRKLSFSLMVALLTLLIADTTLLIIFFVPIAVCPRDTGSIGGMATVFTQSRKFMSAFRGLELKSVSQMACSALGQQKYISSTTPAGQFLLLPQEQDGSPSPQPDESPDEARLLWWRPASVRTSLRLATVLVPLAMITALEALYRVSEGLYGIALVEGKSAYLHYVWVYLPALLMFAIRCLFQAMEFGARIFQPYVRLRQGAAPPNVSIMENQQRKIAIYGVFDAFRKQQWALGSATLALLLAALPAIVVSGLYMADNSARGATRHLTETTRWNLGDPGPTEVSKDTPYYSHMELGEEETGFAKERVAGLVMHLNMSFPKWTYKDLAFPQFEFADVVEHIQSGYIESRLPALRGTLDCSTVENPECESNYDSLFDEFEVICNTTFLKHDPPVGRNSEDIQYFSSGSAPRMDEGSPTHGLVYGKWFRDDRPMQVNIIECDAKIEEVDVDVRLQVPSFSFDPSFEPRIVSGSSRASMNTSYKSFPSLQGMEKYLMALTSLPGGEPVLPVDQTMQAAIYGMGGVPADELLNDADKLISRVNEVWGMTMAQLYNSWGRESFDKPLNRSHSVLPLTSDPPIFNATFYDRRHYLVQNEVSTRILQGVFATMALCAIISIAFMDTKRVLPKEPFSIAAVASFLYGSRMLDLDIIRKGSEWSEDQELRRPGVFEGWTFTMGWWRGESGSAGSGDGRSSTDVGDDDSADASDSSKSSSVPAHIAEAPADGGSRPGRKGKWKSLRIFGTKEDTADDEIKRKDMRFGIDVDKRPYEP